tara:strand:+ start:173 stop:778 length:606 start_codon:yes stop_codon:yes gene_type:complete
MLKNFPEIERFFNQDSFSEKELIKFKETILCSYKEKSVKSKAKSLIDLKLLSFQLKSIEVENKKSVKVKKKSNNKRKRSKSYYETHTIESDTKVNNISSFIGLKLAELADKIKIKPDLVLKVLSKELGRRYDLNYILLKKDVDILESFLRKRLKLLNIEKVKDKDIQEFTRPKRRKRSGSSGVYAEIQKYGVGKLIYIRKS